jgi:hypothetical protein
MMMDDLRAGQLAPAIQILLLVGSAPLQWQKTAPTRDDADRWLEGQIQTRAASTDPDDLLYALDSSRNYDPWPQLERITAPLLAINSADDFINPPELGFMETGIKRVKNGRYLLIPTSDATHGHGTHTWAAVWEKDLRAFLEGVAATEGIRALTAQEVADPGAEGTICIAPVTAEMTEQDKGDPRGSRAHPTSAFSVQIDDGGRIVVPDAHPATVRGLDSKHRHLVRIRDGSRLIESFHFTFASRGGPSLCLSYGPFYETWDLSPPGRRPWCRCT